MQVCYSDQTGELDSVINLTVLLNKTQLSLAPRIVNQTVQLNSVNSLETLMNIAPWVLEQLFQDQTEQL